MSCARKTLRRYCKRSLSYDATFLYLYRAAISEVADCKYEKGVCPFNPLKKCGYICGQDKAFEFVASVTVILSYFKLIDSINDSGFFKRSFVDSHYCI